MGVALITLEGGGISTVCHGLGKSLARRKIPATIFTETSGNREVEKVNDYLKITRLHRVNLPPRFFWFQMQNRQYLLNTLSNFEVIHGVSPDASTLFTFYREKLKKPFVVSFHAEPLSVMRDLFQTPLLSWTPQEFAHDILEFPLINNNIKRCIEYSDHIIVCSYAALREFEAAYEDLDLNRVSVIYNAVNVDEIDNLNVDFASFRKESDLSIIFAGRLMWGKGLQYLLEAFSILKKDFKNIQLEIYGTGPEENRFKKFVSDAGLNSQIHFNGRIPNKALIAETKRADLVVSPSLHEAQSMYVLEAMACGKPLVAFDIPSMSEIITNGWNGILAKPADSQDLSEKIRFLLSNSEQRLEIGKNAYDYVREKHNWDKQIEKYVKVYTGLTQ